MAFVPRPFPPPGLEGVPLEYIKHQLRSLAREYWHDTTGTDCTLYIPLPESQALQKHEALFPSGTVGFTVRASAHDPSGIGRRATEPAAPSAPQLVMQLHTDYLSARSPLFRALVSGAHPLDLRTGAPAGPSYRAPRVLSSTAERVTLRLPLPDPASFTLLVYYIYFGRAAYAGLEAALDAGAVRWDGLARNAEYLGLGDELKAWLGAWWARSRAPVRVQQQAEEDASDEEASSVKGMFDCDGDERMAGSDDDVSTDDDEYMDEDGPDASTSEDEDEFGDSDSEGEEPRHTPARAQLSAT